MKKLIPINTTADGFAYAIKARYCTTSLANMTGGGHFPSTGVIEICYGGTETTDTAGDE